MSNLGFKLIAVVVVAPNKHRTCVRGRTGNGQPIELPVVKQSLRQRQTVANGQLKQTDSVPKVRRGPGFSVKA